MLKLKLYPINPICRARSLGTPHNGVLYQKTSNQVNLVLFILIDDKVSS